MHDHAERGQAATHAFGKGLLARLGRDVRGNALAIVAAALVPLAGMIGSGVDMSRAYMAKTRLQSACDAAALAGRRVMQNDTVDSTVQNEALRFFNFNFRQGLYSTSSFTPTVTRPGVGTVRVTASTQIPTSIMRLFGFTTLPLNVTCDASLNFVNTDVMLVLDVTGSMAEDVNGNFTFAASNQKIFALREAVMALYDELRPIQTQLEANNLRLRYGVVPYSSTVNVGTLIRDANPAYLADSVAYQSRVANYTTQQTSSSANGPYWEIYPTSITQAQCLSYMQNVAFIGFTPTPTSSGGPAPTPTVATTFPHDGVATDGGGQGEWGWGGAPDTDPVGGKSCRRKRTDTTTTYRYTYTNDTFRQETYDTSQFKLGNPVSVAEDTDASDDNDDSYAGNVPISGTYNLTQLAANGTSVGTTNTTWNGCIEERDTVSTITSSSGYAIPSGAYDLNINLIPTNDATRWRPQWPRLIWDRSSSSSGEEIGTAACPAEAVRLQAWNRGQLQSYVEQLQPTGNTYHDIGMIWGARLISSGGIFADSPDTFNAMPVSRHIIFMTDGQIMPSTSVYSSYGVEPMDQRITGSSSASGLSSRHMQRFKMICNATKSMNVSIWVIAFGTTLSNEMIECASSPNQASTAANRDALLARFREIGSNIGALRLTQ